MKAKWFTLGLLAVAATTSALAQDVVGSSMVGGRHIQLYSDNTWKYTSSATSACSNIQDSVSFCGEDLGWKRTSSEDPDIAAMFRLNDRAYAEFVVENLGAEDGITQESMRRIVINNAARGTHVEAKDIVTFGSDPAKVDGLLGETLVYAVKAEGMPFVFINTIVLAKHQTVQIITFSVGQAVTDEMKLNHKRFLEATRLK